MFFDDVTRKKKLWIIGSTIRERNKKNTKYYVGDYSEVSFFPLINVIAQFFIKGISSNLGELYFHTLL